ncbi:ATP-binding protein [Alloscardovia theropitheci]|nr:ATP-binding protein [Alloscardovia theropitheci]
MHSNGSLMYYIVSAAIVALSLRFATAMTWIKTLVVVSCGYATQHIAFDIYRVVLNVFNVNIEVNDWNRWNYSDAYYAVIYPIIFLCAWIFFARRFKFDESKVRRKVKWVCGCIVLIFFLAFVNLYFIQQISGQARMLVYIYDAALTIFVLNTLIQTSTNTQLSYDLMTMKRLDKLQKHHYQLARENVEIINELGHDLRKSMRDQEMISEADQAINIYDSVFRTGNTALDVLLTERSFYCNSHNITLSALADGSKLDFLDDSTVYSIFGNLIDNAIEYIEKSDNSQELSIIDLTIRREANFVIIEIKNPLMDKIYMSNGLPMTTKKGSDTHLHGFGTRSVLRHVHKLGGEMVISTENNTYSVTILIPSNTGLS